ncbi:ATP-binding protein [Listeria seeligeri]|uniref:ATP-binding protein n=1 Tax=Listeria seeligeri TaxID=1640 RepID=UPI00311B060D
MNTDELRDKVLSFIDTKREDDYWDFKQCHQHNKANLLHDIICMANNRSMQDGYIIFGVEDNTFNIVGVETDNNRRSQQNIIDFLKEKSFSMNIRPKIQLITLDIADHQLDILIVHNTLDTPFYLTKDYTHLGRNVKANYIYTRVADTNTDITKSADPNHVEFLWKKRFGIHLSPFDKVRHNLKKKKDWIHTEDTCYHNSNPEYTILRSSNDGNSAEFYAYTMRNKRVSYGNVKVNYFGTTLYSQQTVTLDGGRYTTIEPTWGFINHDKYHQKVDSFKYIIKDDIAYDLHMFLFDETSPEANSAHRRFMQVVLLFEDAKEKDNFINYVKSDLLLFEKTIDDVNDCYDYLRPEREDIIRNLKVGIALKTIQQQFKQDNNHTEILN